MKPNRGNPTGELRFRANVGRVYLPLEEEYVLFLLFSPVGFEGNLSLLEIFEFCSRRLKQMEEFPLGCSSRT